MGVDGLTGATDYYPGGMPMPNRQLVGGEPYRYGYQGEFAETDPETGKPAFELRLYDPRINRWLTPDPYGQHFSSYLAMGNNPVNGIDPDGGVAIPQHMLQSWNDTFGDMSFFASAVGGFDNFWEKVSFHALDEVIISLQENHPYNINQMFTYSKTSADYGFSSWGRIGSTFRPRGTGGGVAVSGRLDANAYVRYSKGNYYLDVNASSSINNDPRNKTHAFLNVKYSNDASLREASESLRLSPDRPMITQKGISYIGSQTLLLPKDPNEIAKLNMTLGVHKRLPGGGVSKIELRADLLQDIIK